MVLAQCFVSLALVLPSCMQPCVLPGRVPLPRTRDPRANPSQGNFMKGQAGKFGLLVNSQEGERSSVGSCARGGGDGGDLERAAHVVVPGLKGDRDSSWMCTHE